MKRKIYLASSWRNTYQADVLAMLREAGHEVYDFKNPAPGNTGFSWKQIHDDPSVMLSAKGLRDTLRHPVARAGFKLDFDAMKWSDCGVLLLPSGMSAHLEAGWLCGSGRPVAVFAPEVKEPELMYKMFADEGWPTPLFDDPSDLFYYLGGLPAWKAP